MQHLYVSGAVRPLKWPLCAKCLKLNTFYINVCILYILYIRGLSGKYPVILNISRTAPVASI